MKSLLYSVAIVCLLGVSAVMAQDAKTPAEWIEIVEKQAVEQEKSFDQEFKTLRLGAALCMGHYNARTDHVRTKYEAKYRSAIDAFLGFMDKKGNGMVDKWLAGEPFSKGDEKYKYIIQGALFYRGMLKDRDIKNRIYKPEYSEDQVKKIKAYAGKIETEALAVLIKGYEQGMLTADDLETLRLYKIRQFAKGGDLLLPFYHGYHPMDGKGKRIVGTGGKSYIYGILIGQSAPDIKSPFLETILNRSGYSDDYDYEYSVTWSYRVEGVLEFLRPLSGYTFKEEDGKRICVRKKEYYEDYSGEKPGEYFKLSSMMGKKPIVIICNDPSDSAFSHWPYSEVMYQAYKDRFDFYCVTVSIWDQTMGNPNYFNPPAKGKRGPRSGHYYSLDDRARRAKNRYIETPYASFPCVLDDMVQTFRNLYVNGGGQNHFTIIDVDGKVTARGQSNMMLPTQWMNDMEQSISKTIDSKGKATTEVAVKKGDDYASYKRLPLPERQYLLVRGTIQSVDKEKQSLKVSARIGKENKEYTVTVAEHARVSRNGKIVSLEDLKAGDRCGFVIKDETYYVNPKVKVTKMGHRHAEKWEITGENGVGSTQVRSAMGAMPYNRAICTLTSDTADGKVEGIIITVNSGYFDSNAWLFGNVVKVLEGGRKITVEQILPTAKEMKGYSFWKEAGARCKLTSQVQERMDIIEYWQGKPESERVYTFAIDDAVGVFLNGKYEGITHKDLKTGDSVGIEVNSVQARQSTIYPNAVRISR